MSRIRTRTAAAAVAALIAGASFGSAGADPAVAKSGKTAKPGAAHAKGKSGDRQVRAKSAGRKVG